MSRRFKAIVITVLLLFFYTFPNVSNAAFFFSISGVDTTVVTSKDQELLVNLSITDLPAGDSYFRVGWESGNSNTGYIKNNADNWIKLSPLGSVNEQNQECFNYFKVAKNGSDTTTISFKIKIGSENDVTNGQINLRAHRFTSTCGSYSSSEPFGVTVNIPTPMPTSSPTPTPTSTPSPTVSSTPTPMPSPSKSPSPTPTPKKSPSPSATVRATLAPEEKLTPAQGEILGLGTNTTPSPTAVSENIGSRKFPLAAVLFITGGLAFVGFALFIFFRSYQKENSTNI